MERTDSVNIELFKDHKMQHFLIYIHGHVVNDFSKKAYTYRESLFVDLSEHRNVELLPSIIRDTVTHVTSQPRYFKMSNYPTDEQRKICPERLFQGSIQRGKSDIFSWFIKTDYDNETLATQIKHNGSVNLNNVRHILFRYLPFQN